VANDPEHLIDLQRLDIVERETAEAVLQLQQAAYRAEAELVGSDRIPALWETLEELRACREEFLGVIVSGAIVGAISWRYGAGTIDIHRLVVAPEYFRRGIATALVRSALGAEPAAARAIVQTGSANEPATSLYEREGFERSEDVELGGMRISRFVKHLRG
jgi:ribosomal protein S18 acetylase RimI-like enzyme